MVRSIGRRAGRLAAVLAMGAALLGSAPPPDTTSPSAPAAAVAPPRRAADADSQAHTTVLVVRHAERADVEGGDPPLSAAGRARARALIDVAEAAGVTAILATPYRRTRMTAQPLADRLALPVGVIEFGEGGVEAHVAEVARAVRTAHAGGVVLVVSHSNVAPLIVRELTGRDVPAIAEDEYDSLFIVTIAPGTAPRLIHARYGAP